MIVLGDFHACGSTELWSQGYSEKLQVGVQCPPRAKKAGNTGILRFDRITDCDFGGPFGHSR